MRNRAWLPAPCMINYKLCINAKKSVQQFFIMELINLTNRTPCHISHCKHSILFKLFCCLRSYPPKISKRAMIPQLLSITFFCKHSNSHAITICRNVLCLDIHCNFSQIKICSDPCSCCNFCCL